MVDVHYRQHPTEAAGVIERLADRVPSLELETAAEAPFNAEVGAVILRVSVGLAVIKRPEGGVEPRQLTVRGDQVTVPTVDVIVLELVPACRADIVGLNGPVVAQGVLDAEEVVDGPLRAQVGLLYGIDV